MKARTKVAWIIAAAAVMGGTGLALAQMVGPPPPDGPMQGLMHRERLSERLVRDFDANHDGKITHAELNNVLGSRFATATHGAKLMTLEQFWNSHLSDSTRHSAAMFRRVDWNNDGRLSLEEFAAPQRAHFEMMDREGTGTVSCSPVQHAGFHPEPRGPAERRDRFGGHSGPGERFGRYGSGGFGLSLFCGSADISRDGTVTRAEFDAVTGKEFATAANGAASMSFAQFALEQTSRFRDRNEKMFKRLDDNGDSKLTLAEFAEPTEKMFDRLDRNRDGVVAADEMKPRFRGREHGGRNETSGPERED